MSFLYPSLAIAGGLLALAPIIAHLLNRRRRKRVAWAAMDFLLESDRRNRTWVQLSEWLLLATRVAAIALAGVLTAGPRAIDWLSGWLDDRDAVHLVLLDDSFSMGQRQAGFTAWDRATNAIEQLIETTSERNETGSLFIARLSDEARGAEPVEAPLGVEGAGSWLRRLESLRPTKLSRGIVVGADSLVERARRAKQNGRACYAYVLSDYRSWNLENDKDANSSAATIETVAAEVDGLVLAACDSPNDANLTLESLELAPGPRAAGVEMRLIVTVMNQSSVGADAVELRLLRDGQPLPAAEIGPFEPRERLVVELPIVFSGEGEHRVSAELPADALPADDRRLLSVDLPAAQRVLLVDGSDGGLEGRAYEAALAPIGSTRTGWAPKRLRSSRPATLGDLSDVAVVMLLDVPELSVQAEQELRRFVQNGGGLLLSLGPGANLAYYNDRLGVAGMGGAAGATRGAERLAPWTLDLPTQAPWVESGRPSLEVADHPALRMLGGERNGFLPLMRVAVRHTLKDAGGEAGAYSPLVELSDGSPLVIENRYGRGRVVTLLTTAAGRGEGQTAWSNLATLPVFPVIANELTGWLGAERLASTELLVGEPIGELLGAASVARLRRVGMEGSMDVSIASPTAELEAGSAASAPILEPGVYRVTGGGGERLFSVGVDPREGDLRALTVPRLRERFGETASVVSVDRLFRVKSDHGAVAATFATAVVLLLLLAGERLLASRCSYLEPRGGGA